jgi:hypothetical protein
VSKFGLGGSQFSQYGERSLADMACSVCEAARIQDGDILVGSSLGGMVACEITKVRRIPVLYLLGSAVRKEEISSLLAAAHPLARVAPLDWLRLWAGKLPNDLAQMFAEAETSFVRAMCFVGFERMVWACRKRRFVGFTEGTI